MRINTITEPLSAALRKIDGAKKTEKETKTTRVQQAADRSEISPSAQRLSETKAQFETISASLATQPDIRTEKVAEVKEKIQQGYYNSEEFIDKLASKLLVSEFGLKPPEA
ncbi:MAG: flagellar biosynthesis anti-sigma factor FlgM [Chitinispirillaceae bacterium]|jgi:flagellar biosynthesis anti-sigma factor FlgM|nr:flagellar biosynthesis anti-sigma factor FlgM [Chitinispirillaceae bacterium]